jgi:hypothetical protein
MARSPIETSRFEFRDGKSFLQLWVNRDQIQLMPVDNGRQIHGETATDRAGR